MADEYADEKYLSIAVPSVVKDSKGKEKTVYLDINTGQEIKNLDGYTIFNEGEYYNPDKAKTDTDKDGTLEPDEVTASTAGGHPENKSVRTDSIAAPKGVSNVSNNFGYTSKPGWMGPAGMVAGMVNPGLGAVASVASKAMNVGNMDAVNSARKGLGLAPLTGGQRVKGALKDNKGQIANVNIGDNKYSVGFEALSPDNKTNLTYSEAKTRAALAKQNITETPKEEVTAPPKDQPKSLMSKLTGLEKGFARKALGIEKKAPEEKVAEEKAPAKSLATKITGLERGWLTKALNHVVDPVANPAPELPDVAPTPSVRPENMPDNVPGTSAATKTFSKEASIGLPDKATPATLGGNPLGIGNGTAKSAAKAGVIDGSKPDRIGRVGLMSVDFDKMGLQPAMAAQMKSFQKAAVDAGIANKLSVDVTNAVRTPEQQKAIAAAGYSKTNFGYHNIGLAVDVSPTAIDAKDRITDQETLDKSRQIAKDLGMGTLNPSWDPAHIQAVTGTTAKAIGAQKIDPRTGLPSMTPEQDLNTRVNSVPTPTARPSAVPSGFVSQDERTATSPAPASTPAPAANEFDTMRNSMTAPASKPQAAVPGANTTKMANTPAGLAAMGFTSYSPSQKAQMARAIAGELGQKSLKALSSEDPAARQTALNELGSMAASMVNRDASTLGQTAKFSWSNPNQVNSLMDKNAAVTNANYANNPAVTAGVNSFFSGGIPGANMKATNWANMDITNPGWASNTLGSQKIGQHTFSTDPAFGPDKATKAAMGAFGTMAGTSFSPGKAKDDTVGSLGSTHPSTYGGAGYTPGGMNSPSASVGTGGVSTGLGGVGSPRGTPGYGGPGMGYGGLGFGAAGTDTGNDKADKSEKSDSTGSSSSSGSSSSGGTGGGSERGGSTSFGGSGGTSRGPGLGGSSSSTSGSKSSSSSGSSKGKSSGGGGYSTGASKGSTGGL